VIIFSQDEEAHIKHLEWVLKSLQEANMRVSVEKSRIFKKSVSFLGFIVTSKCATTDPEKVKAINEFPEPKKVFEVGSFLGLASYYRCFVKDFAVIARPISMGQLISIDRGTLRCDSLSPSERRSKSFAIYWRQKMSCSATRTIRSHFI